jgi:hypothetical protein
MIKYIKYDPLIKRRTKKEYASIGISSAWNFRMPKPYKFPFKRCGSTPMPSFQVENR